MSVHRAAVLVLALQAVGLAPAFAQAAQERGAVGAPQTLQALAIPGEIVLDGRLTEQGWIDAPVASGFVQRAPNPGAAASRDAEVRVLYRGGDLYVGARLFDAPDSIAAQLGRRDASGIYSDWFSVLLDSDNDRRSAFVMGTTPRGVERDYTLSEDGVADFSWDAVWEVRTAVDSLGWTAEFRIPVSQLRYSRGAQSWGLNFQRTIARREESAYWAPIPPDASGFISRFGALTGMAALAAPAYLELNPYAVTRLTRAPGNPADPFHSRNEPSVSAGLDLRYGITPDLRLTATVNPDFGQVEADPSVVNLTAFEIRFPERRPFFTEGADIFEFEFGGDAGSLFYSRRIGAPPHGGVPSGAVFRDVPDQSPILAAAKVSGKTAGGWSMGFLEAVTGSGEASFITADGLRQKIPVEPLTNYGVARVIRDFDRGASSFGAILTSTHRRLDGDGRLDFLPSAAITGALDGRHRFGGGSYEFNGYVGGSHVRGSRDAILPLQRQAGHYFQRPDADHLEVDSTRTSLSGLMADLEINKLGGHWRWEVLGRAWSPSFEVDDLGFQQQADRIYQFGRLEYVQFNPGPVFRNWNMAVQQRNEWTFGAERTVTAGAVSGGFQLRNYWGGSTNIERRLSALDVAQLRGGPALRETGSTSLGITVYSDQRAPVRGVLQTTFVRDDEEGGRLISASPLLELRPSPRMLLSLRPTLSRRTDPAQYLEQRRVSGRTGYFFGSLRQTTASLTARFAYTVQPDLTFEFYGQPFISAVDYSDIKEVADPRAREFDDRFTASSVAIERDFNFKEFRSNAVLRWEYRPGSTLFVVWNSGLSNTTSRDGSFELFRDLDRLFGSEGRNVLLVKLSYWFGL